MDILEIKQNIVNAAPMEATEIPAMRQAEQVVVPAGALAMNMNAQPETPATETLSDAWNRVLDAPANKDADKQPAVTMTEGKNQPVRWGRTGSLRSLGNLAFGPRVAW
jgi:hypothetical protein